MRGNGIVMKSMQAASATTTNENTPFPVLITTGWLGWLEIPNSEPKLFELEEKCCQLIFRFTSESPVATKQWTKCTPCKWFVLPNGQAYRNRVWFLFAFTAAELRHSIFKVFPSEAESQVLNHGPTCPQLPAPQLGPSRMFPQFCCYSSPPKISGIHRSTSQLPPVLLFI